MSSQKVPTVLKDELEKTGLPYRIERGKKHCKIFLSDRMVGIYHPGKSDSHAGRGGLNVRSNIRRLARQLNTNGEPA